jgi:SNF2 family DNA or RNA helicase
MLVLHASFYQEALLLWAEPESSRKALLTAVVQLGGSFKFPNRTARSAVAWLPARGGRPLPSSNLAGDVPVNSDGCRIEPIPVSVLPLDAGRAIDLLAQCAGKRVLASGLLAGNDLLFWTAALRFSASLAMRGQFLPDLTPDGGARWTPVVAGDGRARFDLIAEAMPPSARSLNWDDTEQPRQPAAGVLADFTAFIVDGLVRSGDAVAPPEVNSGHDQWLRALVSRDAVIAGRASELKLLSSQVAEWRRPVQVAARAPVRLCFRLEEPEETNQPWQVHYLLQGIKDPSLLVGAAEAWSSRRAVLSALRLDAATVRENLLTSLGQAAAICPSVERSLKERAPAGYTTDAVGAHEFLRSTAGTLEQSGFGVMLPSWWTRTGMRASLKARGRVRGKPMAGGAGLSLDSIIEFDWELALGGETITHTELAALAKLKAPLVKLRGQWVEVDPAAIHDALEFLKKNGTGTAAWRDVIRMAVGGGGDAGPLEVEDMRAEGWIGDVLDQLQGRTAFEELPPPESFAGTLRPYQLRGYSWLGFLKRLGLGACLADDMGLGKTIQTLALLQRDWNGGERRPALLVCPTSVVGNWHKEAARFTPELAVMVHHGVARHRGEAFRKEAERHALVLSSYALLHRDLPVLGEIDWAGVILDEAQNIKNAETMQSRAARSLKGGYRIALTGTPVENNVGDLWSVMEFLNTGFLGSQSGFRKHFFIPIQVYSDRDASERLRRITGPFILRRLKTDRSIISDLPEKQEMKVFCNLTREQASLYQAVVKDAHEAIESAEGITRKGLVLATLVKLKQVCNHPAQFLKDNSAIDGRSGKLACLAEMIGQVLEVGDRALIFTQFTEMGEILKRHLQETFGVEVMYLHGGSTKKQRDAMVERFAREDGPRLFLLSLKAGGTGLNLTRANHVFHFDRWWNPAVENQATDRAFRIGQMRNVQVHKFLCVGTLEERIDEMIERKKDVAGRVVGTGEAWLSEMSNAELRALFELRKDAIGD